MFFTSILFCLLDGEFSSKKVHVICPHLSKFVNKNTNSKNFIGLTIVSDLSKKHKFQLPQHFLYSQNSWTFHTVYLFLPLLVQVQRLIYQKTYLVEFMRNACLLNLETIRNSLKGQNRKGNVIYTQMGCINILLNTNNNNYQSIYSYFTILFDKKDLNIRLICI